MIASTFVRWSGIAGIVGGLLVGARAFLVEPFTGQYALGGLMTIVTLIGILLVLRQEGAGRWALFGIVAALVGQMLFALEQLKALAGLSYGLGLVLLAVGLWKTDVFPRWLPALWVLVPLAGVLELIVGGAADFLTTLATIVFGLAFIGAGYSLSRAPRMEGAARG